MINKIEQRWADWLPKNGQILFSLLWCCEGWVYWTAAFRSEFE